MDEHIEMAVGIYMVLEDELFSNLHASDAQTTVDILVKYRDQTRGFNLREFLQLLDMLPSSEK